MVKLMKFQMQYILLPLQLLKDIQLAVEERLPLHVDVPHVAEGEGRPEGGEAGHRRPLAVVPGHRCYRSTGLIFFGTKMIKDHL